MECPARFGPVLVGTPSDRGLPSDLYQWIVCAVQLLELLDNRQLGCIECPALFVPEGQRLEYYVLGNYAVTGEWLSLLRG